ncbi:MAG: hypothetical protein ACO3GP_09125 [Candidatus Limnocylindrus sp.]
MVKPEGWELWGEAEVVSWGRKRRARLLQDEWERLRRQGDRTKGTGTAAERRRGRKGAAGRVRDVTAALRITDFFAARVTDPSGVG